MTHFEIIEKVWQDWTVTGKIGEGSFGQVFRAEKESYGIKQQSAIKVVRIPEDEDELERVRSSFELDDEELKDYFYPQLEKLKKEIELMMKLDDNNIVKIHDFEIKESFDSNIGWCMLIRMELLECLEKYVKSNDITVEDVVNIGEDILSCLQTCEDNDIIHRDIKPANLFRNEKGVYKLGDFGIARDMKTVAGTLSHKGTENYMAPEVYLGKSYTSNIDIYALGIVLYKLLNKNRLPFMNEEKLTAGSVERAFQKRNTGEEVPKPLQASDDLYKIIKKMCAYDPNERFQTAREVKDALRRYRREHKEELKETLSISRKTGIRQADTAKSPDSKGSINTIIPDEVSAQDTDRNSSITNSSKMYQSNEGTVDIKNATPEIINEKEMESIDDGATKSLFATDKQRQKNTQVQSFSQQRSVEEVTRPDNADKIKKKRNKVAPILGIAAGVFMLIIGVFVLIGSNVKDDEYSVTETTRSSKNKKKNKDTDSEEEKVKESGEEADSDTENQEIQESAVAAIAREIADDKSLFEINAEQYAEYYMEYTTTIVTSKKSGELQEVSGVYIGETQDGKPDGKGLFYYTGEVKADTGRPDRYIIYFGEWSKGELKSGSNVKKKYMSYGKDIRWYSILSGEWENGGFVGDMEGIDVSENLNTSTGEWEYTIWSEGVFENKNYDLISGKIYYGQSGIVEEGEFKDLSLYNGTAYDKDGNAQWTVVDGKKQ